MIRKILRKPLSILMLFVTASPCYAARPKKRDVFAADQEVQLTLPETGASVEKIRYEKQNPVDLEIATSVFMPVRFLRATRSGSQSEFHARDLPAFSLNRLAKIRDLADGAVLSTKFGIGYMRLERAEEVAGVQARELFHLLSARIGVLGSWPGLLPLRIVPSFGFNFLPTWGSAASSVIEKSVSAFGLPIEATLGFFYRPLTWDVGFGISGQAIFGSIGGSSLNGLGLTGEVRVGL